MQYKENVFIDEYAKRKGGKIYRDVRFHVKGAVVIIENLLVASNDSAYKKAKELLSKANEL